MSGDTRIATVVEVGPRDGLQNEKGVVDAATKVAFIDALTEAGHRHIEVGAFVHPDRVPQMANTAEVFQRIRQREGVIYTALVPNQKGLERALRAGVQSIAVVVGATNSFNRANLGQETNVVLHEIAAMVRTAEREALLLRAYISVAFVCPYEGPVSPETVGEIARTLADLGAGRIVISDTIGAATPQHIDRLLGGVEIRLDPDRLALHLHDTRGQALANVRAGLASGIIEFDASAGGLGGCPFAPGAPGNLSTEKLIERLHAEGYKTGVNEAKQRRASQLILAALGRT